MKNTVFLIVISISLIGNIEGAYRNEIPEDTVSLIDSAIVLLKNKDYQKALFFLNEAKSNAQINNNSIKLSDIYFNIGLTQFYP